MTVGAHGLHLLKLIGGKNRGELLLRALMNGARLFSQLVVRESRITSQGCHLLAAIGEDWLEFGRLVRSEVEFFSEPRGFLLGIVRVVTEVFFGRSRSGGGRLCKGESARECECYRGGDEDALHRVLLLVAAR